MMQVGDSARVLNRRFSYHMFHIGEIVEVVEVITNPFLHYRVKNGIGVINLVDETEVKSLCTDNTRN